MQKKAFGDIFDPICETFDSAIAVSQMAESLECSGSRYLKSIGWNLLRRWKSGAGPEDSYRASYLHVGSLISHVMLLSTFLLFSPTPWMA